MTLFEFYYCAEYTSTYTCNQADCCRFNEWEFKI